MIVIADTTPLNHLILIDRANILQALYGRVIIPRALLAELQVQATRQRSKRGSVIAQIGWKCTKPRFIRIRAWTNLTRASVKRSSWRRN